MSLFQYSINQAEEVAAKIINNSATTWWTGRTRAGWCRG